MHPDPSSIRVVSCPHPFTTERACIEIPAGGTLADIMALVQGDALLRVYAHVFVDDCLIPFEAWARVKPKAGHRVTVRMIPHGGGGGGGGKNPLRTVLSIAIVAATMVFAAPLGAAFGLSSAPIIAGSTASLASLVGGAIITVAGTLALNALVPPPKSSNTALARGSLDSTSPTLSITGNSNQADPYGPVPRVYGRHRLYPKKAARDFTEVSGTDQYLRCLFDVGYGPLDLSELRIGTIPLEQFDGVEIEIRQGYADDAPVGLYSNTIREDSYSLKLSAAAGRQIVETRDETDEITLDLSWDGLVHWDSSANRQNQSVTVRIEWRAVGANDWTLHVEDTVTAATEAGVRRDWRIVPGQSGRYQVAVTRITADSTRTDVRDTCYLTALRSVQYVYPVRRAGRCLVALRIKATNQLNGAVDQFSAIAQARLQVWDGAQWTEQTTRNPAWAFCDVLTGAANRRPVALSRLDLRSIKEWADTCDQIQADGQPRWTFDAVIDYASTVFDVLRDIAASARASLSLRDGRFSVVRDHPQTVPVQLFTPRNSWGFRASLAFADLPHALRVRYIEPERDWSQQEVTVYADGYTEETASRFEPLETVGCTNRAQAWREGRYHMAVARLRPSSYEFQADVEHLVCERGDLISVSHDVPLWGSGCGRIKDLTYTPQGAIATCELDASVTMEAGKSYVLRVRNSGVGEPLPVVTVAGETTRLTFLVPTSLPVTIGDLAVFGESERESALLLVKAIYPGPDLSARIVCVDAAPAVHQAESGEIPDYDPGMTAPALTTPTPPPMPLIESIRSDEGVMLRLANGVLIPRIIVTLVAQAGIGDGVECQYRRTGDVGWQSITMATVAAREVLLPDVTEGREYEIRLRALSRTGIASAWTAPMTHQVIGKTSPPPAPSALYVEQVPGNVLRYRVIGEVAPDHAGWLFRWSPGLQANWEAGQSFGGGIQTTATIEAAAFIARTFVVMVRAIDSSGLVSTGQATAIVQLGDDMAGHVVDIHDFGADGWQGDLSGGIIEGQLLVASPTEALFSVADMPLFDAADAGLLSVFMSLEYIARLKVSRKGYVSLTWDMSGQNYTVETRRHGVTAMFSSASTPAFVDASMPLYGDAAWLPWLGPYLAEAGEEIDIRMHIPGGAVQGVLKALLARIDVPVVEERIDDFVVPVGGGRLPLSRPYQSIARVSLTLQGVDGYSAVSVALIDKAIEGPFVLCLDRAGMTVAGIIDADVQAVLKD